VKAQCPPNQYNNSTKCNPTERGRGVFGRAAEILFEFDADLSRDVRFSRSPGIAKAFAETIRSNL
jgi:hypothetical protein